MQVNYDVIQLKTDCQKDVKAEQIVSAYFIRKTSSPYKIAYEIMMNIVVKLSFILANFLSLLASNNVLNGGLMGYGMKWIKWDKQNNTMQYDYMGLRDEPKPG